LRPEEKARSQIDELLEKAGWSVMDYKDLNLGASLQYLVYWILIKLLLSGKEILIVLLVFILFVNTTNLTFPNAVDYKFGQPYLEIFLNENYERCT
jgi:hypothetical protein